MHGTKVVNGPEILNKFVGQSEENIRKLFADAEKEVVVCNCAFIRFAAKEKATRAVCTSSSSTNLTPFARNEDRKQRHGVGDSIVNQLLSKASLSRYSTDDRWTVSTS